MPQATEYKIMSRYQQKELPENICTIPGSQSNWRRKKN